MENPVRGYPKFSKVIPQNLPFHLRTLPGRILYEPDGGVLIRRTGIYCWPNPSVGFGLFGSALMIANFIGEMT